MSSKSGIRGDRLLANDKLPYVKVHWPMLYDTTLSHGALRLYLMLSSRCIRGTSCFPSQLLLGKNLGVKSRRTIRGWLVELESRQLVTTEVSPSSKGRKNTYIVHHPSVFYGEDEDECKDASIFYDLKGLMDGSAEPRRVSASPDREGVVQKSAPGVVQNCALPLVRFSAHKDNYKSEGKSNRKISDSVADPVQSIASERECWDEEDADTDTEEVFLVDECWEDADDDSEEEPGGLAEKLPDAPAVGSQQRLYGSKGRKRYQGSNNSRSGRRRPRNESVEEVWGTYRKHLLDKWPDVSIPLNPSSREAGQIKNTLLSEYGVAEVSQMARLIIWDWEAIQGEWREAYKTGPTPTVNNMVSMRRVLAGAIKTGVTSQQKRVSQFKKRFLRSKEKANKGKLKWTD